ncbi:Sphingolipid long chain base-responsive protein PIL1 [Grifola frondosa]|uniref:Sphingolipid long chain base-responsive protein PIL1 n=1 Tax=Grifola frondosa TaxID=5627 RepID=A0A1C7MLR0_GRIFR|nr:Sphingolipid long chain base-responsive protein PIL1 [Grifola frondosa]
MFKTAAKKLAHNSTIPALAGNKDLRSLQDLITAEKSVLNSLHKLSADIARACEALKLWGMGEGDDLGDTLTASTSLYSHFATALGAFAGHEIAVREHMKAVRSREENLDVLRRRRKLLAADADSAERKLSKMGPDNKNLTTQTDHLNKLREEIRMMDSDIMSEEANLGDFKRQTVRTWMGLKFGGLLECCEKGAIVGELGKLVISEIPLDPTQPGLPRAYYTGHARTEFLVAEAHRSVNEVVFSPEPNPNPSHRSIRPLPGTELPAVPSPSQQMYPDYASQTDRPSSISMPSPIDDRPSVPSPKFSQGSGSSPGAYPGLPQVEETGFTLNKFLASDTPQSPPSSTVNEFGTYASSQFAPRTSSLRNVEDKEKAVVDPRGGRFATFPVKAHGPRPIPASSYHSTPSSSIAAPPMVEGDGAPSLDVNRGEESFASSVAQALGTQWQFDRGAGGSGPSTVPPRDVKGPDFAPQRYSPPPPVYTPAGAAPAQPPQAQYNEHASEAPSSSVPSQSYDDDNEPELAYMSPTHDNESDHSLSDRGDRRVRFGSVDDIDTEMERRASEIPGAPNAEHEASPQANAPAVRESNEPKVSQSPVPISPVAESHPEPEQRGRSPPNPIVSQRMSIPPHDSDPMDETTLNAAAAREVSRELDALMFRSPPPQPDRQPSPLRPPQPPFARRAVSPRPNMDMSASQPSSPKLESEPESVPAAPAPSASRFTPSPDGRTISPTPVTNVPKGSPSPPLSVGSSGAHFRTPPEGSPVVPPSLYNLPAMTGSGSSFSSMPGTRTISAAAFRRPQMRTVSGSLSDNGSLGPGPSPGLADTSPLAVKKRPLPSSPYPSPRLQGPTGQVTARVPSAPALSSGGPKIDEGARLSHYRDDGGDEDDEYDFVSAYGGNSAPGGGDSQNSSGYGQGRFATNLETTSLR